MLNNDPQLSSKVLKIAIVFGAILLVLNYDRFASLVSSRQSATTVLVKTNIDYVIRSPISVDPDEEEAPDFEATADDDAHISDDGQLAHIKKIRRKYTEEEVCETWDDETVKSLLLDKCSYYIDAIKNWRHEVSQHSETIYAWQQRSGAGDRMAGLVSAFHTALTLKRKLVVNWEALDAVLQPSCLVKDLVSINGESMDGRYKPKNAGGKCSSHSCAAARKRNYPCEKGEDLHLVDSLLSIRGCASSQRCREIATWQKEDPTVLESTGCAIRTMFEPRPSFLNSPVSYFFEGEVYNSTLIELAKMLKENYRTIGMHLRTGDSHMIKHDIKNLPDTRLKPAKKCLLEVEDYLVKSDNKTKEVKWVIASDSEQVRKYFRDTFPDKVIVLMIHPEHISKSKATDKKHSAINIFQEFYLLGKTDEIVVSHGRYRMSAYSKFARLFNLKSTVFAMNFRGTACLRKEVDYDGNIRPFPKQCLNNDKMGHYDVKTVNGEQIYKYRWPKIMWEQPQKNDPDFKPKNPN